MVRVQRRKVEWSYQLIRNNHLRIINTQLLKKLSNSLIKNICKKSIANFIVDGKRQNAFSLSLRTRQEYLLSLYACSLSRVRLFLTLWAVSCQASLCMDFFFFQARVLEWVAVSSSRGSNSILLGLLHCRHSFHSESLRKTCFHLLSLLLFIQCWKP